MKPDDHELMRRAARDDEAAFAELVRRWDAPVLRLLSRLAPRDDAVDLRQESFLRVYRSRARYRSQGCFSTWLYRIVLNVSRDAARRRSNRNSHEMSPAALSEEPGPCESFESREVEAMVNESLARLPADSREVVILKHFCQMTFADMSDVLQTPPSTLKSRLTIALKQLRRELSLKGLDQVEIGLGPRK